MLLPREYSLWNDRRGFRAATGGLPLPDGSISQSEIHPLPLPRSATFDRSGAGAWGATLCRVCLSLPFGLPHSLPLSLSLQPVAYPWGYPGDWSATLCRVCLNLDGETARRPVRRFVKLGGGPGAHGEREDRAGRPRPYGWPRCPWGTFHLGQDPRPIPANSRPWDSCLGCPFATVRCSLPMGYNDRELSRQLFSED